MDNISLAESVVLGSWAPYPLEANRYLVDHPIDMSRLILGEGCPLTSQPLNVLLAMANQAIEAPVVLNAPQAVLLSDVVELAFPQEGRILAAA